MPSDEELFNADDNDHMLEDDNHEDENENSEMEVDDDNSRVENSRNEDEDMENNDSGLGNEDDDEEDDEEDEEGDDEEGDDEEGDDEEGDEEEGDEDEENEGDDENDENEEVEKDLESGNTIRPQQKYGKSDSSGLDQKTGEADSNDETTASANGNTSGQHGHPSETHEQSKNSFVGYEDTLGIRAKAREAAQKASEFDIVPVVAMPYAQQCHSIAMSEGPKWLITGGEDGFIRKYDFAASIDGKAPLTVAQKHNLMDNVNKAGVIGSYWENEQPMTKSQIINNNPKFRDSDFTTGYASYEPKTNPVYSLDIERNGLWCLSGLLSGGISLYTMLYNEGAIHHYFRHDHRKNADPTLESGHSDAVSVLKINHAQNAVLSGSWDKTIREWDLNTGKAKNLYKGSTGQISSVHFRPVGLTDLTFDESNSDVDSLFGSDEEDDNGDASGSGVEADPSKNKIVTEDAIFMSSSIDGAINIWDARVSGSSAVLKFGVPEGTPPWCMTANWSNDGDKIYVGRRNSTVEEFSLRMPHDRKKGNVLTPNISKRLLFPKISGPVSALSVMPNDNFLFCGSNDNIRLYNLSLYDDFTQDTATAKKRATPFYVIPGHHGGVLSNLIVDDTGRFLISTSGNRGWGHSPYADVVLIYSIDTETPQQ